MKKGSNSLSGKIFTTVVAFVIAAVLVVSVVLTSIFYYTFEHDAELELAATAQNLADYLDANKDADDEELLAHQSAGTARYTLITPDGTVEYDSAVDASTLENHASRPEVQAAESAGEAVTSRHSGTLQQDTLYAAVKLDDGNIVRVAETRKTLVAFLGEVLLPTILTVVAVALIAFVLSRALTKRIMKPIDALDFTKTLENDIYDEMRPLLARIDDQQKLLKKQNDELAEAESARREFSSNVSHEMKTPLQVISGYAELMQNDMVKKKDRQKFAGIIYDEAQRMRNLINDVLTLSKLDESAFQKQDALPVDLLAVAERMSERLEGFANEAGVALRVSGAHVTIAGNESLIEEMMYNLVENGIRYNHEGGSIAVRVSMEYLGEAAAKATTLTAALNGAGTDGAGADGVGALVEPAGRAEYPEKMAVVRISDTGKGIPLDEQEKIFERFYRVDKSRSKETGGTGLGLAIVKHAVLYHEGAIAVESKPGEGTMFTLRFPAL